MDTTHQFVKAPLSLANAHSYSARVIEQASMSMDIRSNDDKHRKVGMLISSILLRAFVLELYLKGLCYCQDGEQRTGHSLRSLFCEIHDGNRQSEIGRKFQNATGRDIEQFLIEIDNAFVFWRYLHESLGKGLRVTVDTEHMDELARLLSEEINERLASRT